MGREECRGRENQEKAHWENVERSFKANDDADDGAPCGLFFFFRFEDPHRSPSPHPTATRPPPPPTTAGCSEANAEPVWRCRGHSVCSPSAATQHVLYGWAKDAPPAGVPAGAAFRVGDGTGTSSLVMQVHFTTRRPPGDRSGVRLHLEAGGGGGGAGGGGGGEAGAAFSAGLTMFARYFQIPPREPEVKVPNQCCLRGFEPQHAFAFRVHAHDMGRYENSSFISFCAVF